MRAKPKLHCCAGSTKRRPGFGVLVAAALLPLFYTPGLSAQSSTPHQVGRATATIPAIEPPVMDNTIFVHVLLDEFEARTNGSDNELRWDGEGWIGTDMNRLWLKSEGFSDNSTVSDGDHEGAV